MTRRVLAVDLAGKVAAFLLWARHPWFAAAGFFLPDFYVLYCLLVPSSSGLLAVFTRFATPQREVCLTIDDGPDGQDTPRILDLLDRHGARATFFLVGARAEAHPALTAEIHRRGHEVAHHTYSHPARSFWCASPGRVARELDRALPGLRPGGALRWFRPPVGIKSLFLERALARRGLACVTWTIRSLDSLARDPAKVAAHVMARVRPGAIILMHEGEGVDARVRVVAIAQVLAALEASGYRCVIPRQEQLR